jgi:hypothetical protein
MNLQRSIIFLLLWSKAPHICGLCSVLVFGGVNLGCVPRASECGKDKLGFEKYQVEGYVLFRIPDQESSGIFFLNTHAQDDFRYSIDKIELGEVTNLLVRKVSNKGNSTIPFLAYRIRLDGNRYLLDIDEIWTSKPIISLELPEDYRVVPLNMYFRQSFYQDGDYLQVVLCEPKSAVPGERYGPGDIPLENMANLKRLTASKPIVCYGISVCPAAGKQRP